MEDFVRALARDAFLRAHRDRQRVPSGFFGGMSLQLAAVTSGSAVAEITLVAEAPGLFGSPLQPEHGKNGFCTCWKA